MPCKPYTCLLEQHEQHDREKEERVHVIREDHVEDGHRIHCDGGEEDEGGDPRTGRETKTSLPKGVMARPSEAASCRITKMKGTKRMP